MAKEVLLWDDPKYTKNKNGNQDLERFLANPALNAKDSFKKLNINYDDIKQSLYNLNKKNPEYQKELPSGLDNETGFVLKHQLDAFYNGYSDTTPDKVMGIENIKRLQNPTTKEAISKLVKEHDIKGDLNNLKTTNEDNIISLSRMGLLELNEKGKRLSPKNTKKTVSDNMASAFKAKLENDPTYIASMKAKEKAGDKNTEETAGKKSTLADEIREMNAQIIADTNSYYASHGRPSLNSYSAVASKGNTVKNSSGNKTIASANKTQKIKQSSSKDSVSKNKKSEKSEAQTNAGKKNKNLKEGEIPAENQDAVNQPQNAPLNNTNGSFQETGAPQQTPPQNFYTPLPPQDTGSSNTNVNYNNGSANNSQTSNPQNSKPKFYSGSTVINGANLKLEFELGKAKWKAGYGPESGRAAGKKEEESLRNQIKSKYENMQVTNGKNPREYWIKQYKKAISDEMKKPVSSDREARINALNEGIKAAETVMKAKGEAMAQNVDSMYPVANGATTDLKGRRMDKYVQNPSTSDDYKHNLKVAELKLKEAENKATKAYNGMEKYRYINNEGSVDTGKTKLGGFIVETRPATAEEKKMYPKFEAEAKSAEKDKRFWEKQIKEMKEKVAETSSTEKVKAAVR